MKRAKAQPWLFSYIDCFSLTSIFLSVAKHTNYLGKQKVEYYMSYKKICPGDHMRFDFCLPNHAKNRSHKLFNCSAI